MYTLTRLCKLATRFTSPEVLSGITRASKDVVDLNRNSAIHASYILKNSVLNVTNNTPFARASGSKPHSESAPMFSIDINGCRAIVHEYMLPISHISTVRLKQKWLRILTTS